MSHHTPAKPGSTRSVVAPHMFVLGDTRAMLSADLQLSRRLLNAAEAELIDAILTWLWSHGATRMTWRQVTRYCINKVRSARTVNREALHRAAASPALRLAA